MAKEELIKIKSVQKWSNAEFQTPFNVHYSRTNDAVIKLMFLLPVTTLFQPFGLFNDINRVLVFLIIVLLFFSFAQTRYRRRYWLMLPLVGALVAYDLYISNGQYMKLNDPVYLPFWFLLMMFFSENFENVSALVKKNLSYIQIITYSWCILVGLSAFFPQSYQSTATLGWGTASYFGSIPGSIWRLAPSACLIQSLLIICLAYDREHRNRYLALNIVPLYCGFMGGSRTYFLVIALYFVLFLYYYANNTALFRKYFIATLIVAAAIMMFGATSIVAKFTAAQNNNSAYLDMLGKLTSGRTVLWQADANYYLNANIINQIIGSGYDMIYQINLGTVLGGAGTALYAHNDFLNILVANGFAGLLVYLIGVFELMSSFHARYRASKFIFLLCIFIWLFNASFNMIYCYTTAAIAFAVLPHAVMACERARGISSNYVESATNEITDPLAIDESHFLKTPGKRKKWLA